MIFSKVAENILLAKNKGSDPLIFDTQSALDLIAAAWENDSGSRLIIRKEDISENFFDLKNGTAGEILQKFVNYRFRIAIVGDFSSYTSKSLKDFIYESNKSKVICFTDSMDSAIDILSQ